MVNMGKVAYALEIKFLREYSKRLFSFAKENAIKISLNDLIRTTMTLLALTLTKVRPYNKICPYSIRKRTNKYNLLC